MDVVNISAGGGGGYFALEVFQAIAGAEGFLLSSIKIALAGTVALTSILALLSRDSNGDGTPDFVDQSRTICRAFRRKKSVKCDAPPPASVEETPANEGREE